MNGIRALPQFKPYQDKQTYASDTLTYAFNRISTQKMNIFRNKLQSNSKLNREGCYEVGQNFNLPRVNHFSQEQAYNFLRVFDRTPKNVRQNYLNHYKFRLNYLSIEASNVHSITLNLLRDQVALLELIFEYIM